MLPPTGAPDSGRSEMQRRHYRQMWFLRRSNGVEQCYPSGPCERTYVSTYVRMYVRTSVMKCTVMYCEQTDGPRSTKQAS